MAQKSGKPNQNLVHKGKISYDEFLNCPNKTANNTFTFKTQIYRGFYEKKMMACIRRYEKASLCTKETSQKVEEKVELFQRDIKVLQQPNHLHENFIRYLCCEDEVDPDFIYVATEWCICSVEDLYKENGDGLKWRGEKIYTDLIKKSLGEKEILRQATEGLAFLHALKFVHRNLKPSNFMIAQLQQFRCDRFRYLVKLSDFRMSKNPVECPIVSGTKGSNGWTYPKQAQLGTKADPLTYFRGDIFILGCFFYYVLTNGKHPFGEDILDRQKNIDEKNFAVYNEDWKPDIGEDLQASLLIKKMITFDLNDNFSLNDVIESKYFLRHNFYKLYDLPGVKPGLCVIFNQENFEDKSKTRLGSNLDEVALRRVFEQLGFDVEIYQDLKAKYLCSYIDDLTKQDFSSYASLVVCILSHGAEGVVEGVDDVNVNINEQKYKFNSNDCPTLNGKPKIWIIQACQGSGVQNPIQPNSSQVYTSSNSNRGDNVPQQEFCGDPMPVPIKRRKELSEEEMPSSKVKQRPPLSDFLDVRASISGYAAFRAPGEGSYLIQYLCKELEKEFLSNNNSNQEPKSLYNILHNVQDHIDTRKIFIESESSQELVEVKQTIEWRASLNDHISFKKADTLGKETKISKREPQSPNNWTETKLFLDKFLIV